MLFNLSERKGVVIICILVIAIFIVPKHLLPKEHDLFFMATPVEVVEGVVVEKALVEKTLVEDVKTEAKVKAKFKGATSKSQFESKPQLQPQPQPQSKQKPKPKQKPKRTLPLELNSADSLGLVRLRGIGPYYASKILRYRKRLGGFQSVKQLKDLNMTYFDVDSLAHLFTVDTSLIHKVDMDSMSFKDVLRHPYLEFEDVQMIFNAKRKYGNISYVILEKYKILADYKLKKIRPYFK